MWRLVGQISFRALPLPCGSMSNIRTFWTVCVCFFFIRRRAETFRVREVSQTAPVFAKWSKRIVALRQLKYSFFFFFFLYWHAPPIAQSLEPQPHCHLYKLAKPFLTSKCHLFREAAVVCRGTCESRFLP